MSPAARKALRAAMGEPVRLSTPWAVVQALDESDIVAEAREHLRVTRG